MWGGRSAPARRKGCRTFTRRNRRELPERRSARSSPPGRRYARGNMSTDLTVPQLGESIVEATVGQWRKAEGDAVTAGEPLVELETDKVNIEVSAPEDGVLTSILKHEGDTVAVGETLAQVGAG